MPYYIPIDIAYGYSAKIKPRRCRKCNAAWSDKQTRCHMPKCNSKRAH